MAGRIAFMHRICTCLIFVIILLSVLLIGFAADADDADREVKFTGDLRWYPDSEILSVSGGVTAEYQGITITADGVQAFFKTNMAEFTGNVKLKNEKSTVYGDQLVFNMKTKDWLFSNGHSELTPSLFDNMLISSVYVKGEKLTGEAGRIDITNGSMTTCELEHPHYYFSVKSMTVYPESRIIAHDVSLFALDRRLFSLGSLIIPLRGLRTTLVPQIGSSADEGFFLKAAYTYTATRTQTGILKLDLMTKKGIGLGINQTYQAENMNGSASIYYLNDHSIGGTNITGNLNHRQKIGDVNLSLTSNYRQNSYLFFPATTSQDNQLTLNRSGKSSNTSLSIRSSSNKGSGESQDTAISLRQMQQLSNTMSASFTVDMRSNHSTGMSAADRELETAVDLVSRMDKYDLTLSSNYRADPDGDEFTGDDQFGGLEKLPELTYQTDSYRLGDKTIIGLPFRLSISAGNYREMPSGVTNGRIHSRLDVLEKPIDIGDRNELSFSGAFSQAYYANDMMQYMLKLNGLLTTRYSDYLKSRLSWSYQQPNGYSPFRFDYTGRYNFTRAIFDYQDSGKLRWSLASGYNINRAQAPWQDLALRVAARPVKNTAMSLSTGYDFNSGRWKILTNQMQFSLPGKLMFDIGTRYDMDKGKVDLMRGRFDIYAGKKWRLEGIASWNGITNAFDYRALRVTRDLHCWEASITYNDETGFRQNRGISLDFRIKALPRQDRLGIGQFGQMVDTSMGEYNY